MQKGQDQPGELNPSLLIPSPPCLLAWEVRGLGPMQETAKALLFHDPLLIRAGLATKSKTHSHKNMIFAKRRACWLRGCVWWQICIVLFFIFPPSVFSSFLFAATFFFFCDSGFLFYFV